MADRTERTSGWTPEQQAERKKAHFLRVYWENGGFMERAIRTCKTSRRFIDEQRELDPDFDAMIANIRTLHNEAIEQEVYRRAILGNEKPLSYQGKLTGDVVKEYSDTLLMFYAKANMPEKYRDLPQKGREVSDEELNQRITSYLEKRMHGPKALQTSDTVN